MNRSTFSLFIAILIHLVLVLLFWVLGSAYQETKKELKKEEKKIKISLKDMPKKYKKTGEDKKKTKVKKIAPPMPKGKQFKKIIKKPLVKLEPKKPLKQPTLNKPIIEPKKIIKPRPKTKPLPPKKKLIPIKVKKKDPMSWLYEDKSTQETKVEKKKIDKGGSISQNIKELYGDVFGKLTHGQQQYIIDNQEIMRRITQEVLNRVARVNINFNLNVNRTNVVEFYLHPNGDMTDFKLLVKSGYYELDNTTKETIEYSYSRYPRPTEKTLIRYNVYYNLARTH